MADRVGEGLELLVHGAQLLLDQLALRDVPSVDDYAPHGRLGDQVGSRDLHEPPGPVGVAHPDLDQQRDAGIVHAVPEQVARPLGIIGVHELEGTASDPVPRVVAKNPLHGRAHVGDAGVRPEQRQNVGGVLDQEAELRLVPRRGFLVGFALDHLLGDGDEVRLALGKTVAPATRSPWPVPSSRPCERSVAWSSRPRARRRGVAGRDPAAATRLFGFDYVLQGQAEQLLAAVAEEVAEPLVHGQPLSAGPDERRTGRGLRAWPIGVGR